jgi:hypothetical protein
MTDLLSLGDDAQKPKLNPQLRSYEFVLPFCTESLNVRDRKHHMARHSGLQRMMQEVMAAIGGPRYFPRPPFQRARVTVVRCSAGQLDPDNLVASVKSLVDSLTVRSGVGVIADDSPGHIELVVRQADASRGAGTTLVRIEELAALPEVAAPVKLKKRPYRKGAVRKSSAGITRGIISAAMIGRR